jgi:MFS transporter, DHA2 family, multidrug resistance protein
MGGSWTPRGRNNVRPLPSGRAGGRKRRAAVTSVPAPLVAPGADAPIPAPITCAGIAAQASGTRYIRLSADSLRPYVGILGVLIGAILSFTGSRITTFGLADLRGGLHFGFDEGAWMTTSFGVGQMLVGVACPYLGAIFSVRRILLHGMALLFVASLLGPLSPNLTAFLTAQFLAGVGTGTFIPLTIGFIVRNLPQRLVVYGLAVYAMNSELSQNVSASLEGWYSDNLSWRWIEWQYCVALPVMFACIWYGAPREKINIALLRDLDWPGLAYSGIGFGLLYAGLDQGNRLDWVNNGLVNGLLLSGGLLTLAFVGRELWVEKPFLNLRLLAREGIVPILLILAGFRFIILSTAYIIPTYLQVVQNYRELQVGAVLLWIALPQFLIVLPLGWLLSRVDARWILAIGAILIGVACLMGTLLTQDWATDDFLPSQILQAIGQSFALTAVVVLAVKSMNPADVLTIGTLFQTVRLFGGEIGTAFMQTFVRVREQVHSNLIGLHVDSLGGQTADRLAAYRNAVGGHSSDLAVAAERATSLLGSAVAKQAAVLSYIDGFLAAAVGSFVCLLLVALLRRH